MKKTTRESPNKFSRNRRQKLRRRKSIGRTSIRLKKIGKVGKQLLLYLAKGTETFIDGFFWLASPAPISFEEYKHRQAILYRSLERLEKRRLIERKKEGGRLKVSLTTKGLEYAENLELLEVKIKKPKKWDRLFRVVIFDIPEEHKLVREVLREKLKRLGFAQMQKSVFIIPWPCINQIRRIQKLYKADRFIKYLEVTRFDSEGEIKRKFGLSD